jgi:hypothetical protein
VLLHSQVTDIAVALGNGDALRVFADVIRRRFGAEPGVVTNNFARLLQALRQWRTDISVIVAPFNAKGFLMKPTRPVCESLLNSTDQYIIADRVGCAGESLPEAFAYLRDLKIRSALVDVDAVIGSRHPGHQGRQVG